MGLIVTFLLAVVALAVLSGRPPRRRPPRRRPDRRSWPWRRPRADVGALGQHLARSVRAGLSLPQAVDEAHRTLDAATASVVEPLRADLGRGAHLPDALARWHPAAPLPGVASLASVLEAGHQLGGVTARVLDEAADAIAERERIRHQAHTQGTTARWSALVVAAGPVLGLGLSALAQPAALSFTIGTWPGRVCVLAGLVLDGLGAWWLIHLGRSVLARW